MELNTTCIGGISSLLHVLLHYCISIFFRNNQFSVDTRVLRKLILRITVPMCVLLLLKSFLANKNFPNYNVTLLFCCMSCVDTYNVTDPNVTDIMTQFEGTVLEDRFDRYSKCT